jgi:hypothetical protein
MFTQSMYFRVASLPSRCGGYSDTVLTVKPREGGYASYGGRLRKQRRQATQGTEGVATEGVHKTVSVIVSGVSPREVIS